MTTALKNANARKSKRNDGGSLDVSPRAGLNHSVHDSGDRGSPLDDIIRHSARGGNIPERRPATLARSPIGSKGAKGKQRMGRGRGVLTNSRRINGSVIRGVNNGQTSESQFEHYQGQQGQWEGIETAQINTAGNPNLSDIGTRPTFDSHFIASAPLPHSNVPRNHPFSAVDGADESLNFASYNYPYSTQNTNEAAYGASGLSGSSVDPLMMLWGHCGATEQTNMLMNLNTQLKVTIEDMEESMKTIQHDLANCRATNTALQKRLDENQVEMHQLVRERDLASQKLHNSNHTISQQQQSLQVALDDKENLRYGLESQIRELRSRLVSSTDNSNEMASDVRTLLTDLRESNGRVAALESKVSLLESNNVTQSNTNRTLVVEAESLNQQLANERRKVLGLVRDLHSASTQMGRIQELEGRVSLLHNEKISLEKEHIRLLDDMMKVTQSAATAAREEVQAQLVAVSEAAHHWERVSKLLYKDVADRTTTHIRCREECEEAKRGRDEAEMNLRRVRRDLEMSNAKLSIIWPRHVKDTQHFDTPESIISSFKRIQNARNGSNTYNVSKASQIYSSAYAPGVANSNLSFLADIPLEEQVMELHEANSALVVELEAMKIANELLTEQLNDAQGKNVAIVKKATNERDEASDRERKGHQVVMAQNQRIAFLEEQVNLMRGVKVQQGGPSLSIDTLGSNETIIEVFIGQLILYSNIANSNTNPPHQLMSVEDGMPMLFCTIDFLVHETITSTVVTGFNSFFDLSVGYRIKLDSLFLYYLCTRGLVVQLHRLKDSTSKNYSDDITTNSTLTYETIGEGIVSLLDLVNNETLLLSPRPQLKGHITLHPPSGANQSFISPTASVPALEFSVTFRTPFPATFIEQCRKQICSTSVKQRIQESHKYSLLEHQRQRTGATGGDRHSLELSTMSGDPIEVMYPNINIMNPTTGHLSPKQGETDLQQYTTVGAASLALLLDNVKSVSLRPVSLEIEHHLTNIPMLSLFYLVPSLGLNECHVPFPYSAPRYNIQYEAVQVKARTDHFENIAAQLSNKNEDYKTMNGAFTRTISVPSGHRLAQAIQEPIPVFAFNDSEEVFLEESTAPLNNNNNENSAMSSNTSSAKHMKYWGLLLSHGRLSFQFWDTNVVNIRVSTVRQFSLLIC